MTRFGERLLAALATVLVPLALRLLPLGTVLAMCDRWPVMHAPVHSPHALARRVRRWLARGRGPWAGTCLTRSLVLYTMLRQHGHQPGFVVGVDGSTSRFSAHAWVTVAGIAVGEPADASAHYRRLLSHGA